MLDIRLQVDVKDQNMVKHSFGIYRRTYKTRRWDLHTMSKSYCKFQVMLDHVLILNPYWTTDVLIFNVLNMDRKTGEIGPMNGISLSDIHMDL